MWRSTEKDSRSRSDAEINNSDNNSKSYADSCESYGPFIDSAGNTDTSDFGRTHATINTNYGHNFNFVSNNNDMGLSRVVPPATVQNNNPTATTQNSSNSNNRTKSNDDETMEEIADDLSDIWKIFNGGEVCDYKNDEDGKLIVANKSHQQNNFVSDVLEKVRARELLEIGAQEREAINNEVHGVECRSIPETPSLVSSALLQLRREIVESFLQESKDNPGGSTSVKDGGQALFTKDAYKRGLELRSEYIQSDTFLLRFLRAELFDVPKAAQRYFRNLDVNYSFFGDVALNRPLFLTDLTKRELGYLRKGQQQLLPTRDRSDRRVFAFLGCNNPEFEAHEKYRTQAYLFDVMAQSEATQQLGFVYVGMVQNGGKISIQVDQTAYFQKRSHQSCPVRPVALHICMPSGGIFVNLVQAVLFVLFDKHDRSMCCVHSGSHIENNYRLCGFGISSGDIPMTYDGKVKVKSIAKFIRARNSIEHFQKRQIIINGNNDNFGRTMSGGTISTTTSSAGMWNSIFSACPIIECPDTNCVVFGYKNMYEHPGNVRIRHLILNLEQRRIERIARIDDVVTASISGFVDEIVQEARSLRGQRKQFVRFYNYEKELSVYKEITDTAVLNKRILHVLRDVRKRTRGRIGQLPIKMVAMQEVDSAIYNKRQEQQDQQDLGESSILGLDSYKRAKTDEDSSFCSC